MSYATAITKTVTQTGQPAWQGNYSVTGVQIPPLETTVTYGAPLTINDGVGVLYYANLNLLSLLSDNLDCTVKFYAATAAGGALIATISLTAGVPYLWDATTGGTSPLGTTNALSMVITPAQTVGGVASALTTTAIHIRTSLTA